MPDLARVIARQARQIAELQRQARGRSREGVVAEADAATGRYRVDVGAEGRSFLTGWIPAEALSSGGVAVEAGLVVGQRVRVTSESGDLTDAVVALSAFSSAAPRPGAPGGEIVVKATSITLEAGAGKVVITGSGVAVTGPELTHGGTNVGRTHTHPHGDPAGTTGSPS